MEQLTLTHGNEVLTIHKREDGSMFTTFGARIGEKSNMYEMSLTKEDVANLKKFISNVK